jgi:hypothetical protein
VFCTYLELMSPELQALEAALEALEREWRSALFEPPPPDREFWHYSSAAGAHAILSGRTLHAGHISHSNDPQELTFTEDVLRSVATSRIVDHDVVRGFLQHLDRVAFSRRRELYIACFSEDGDLRSQWVEYGDTGRGVALGFDPRELERTTRTDGWSFVRVRYGNKELVLWFVNTAAEMAKAVDKHTPEGHPDREQGVNLGWQFLQELLIASAAVKHEGFQAEREWRLFRLEGFDKGVVPLARASGARLIAYLPVPVGTSVRSARFGTRCERGSQLAIGSLLEPSVAVDRSAIPFK